MAIQLSDYMDFGNGIIGDDTFDVWRKKTNRIQVNLDSVNSTLNNKIDTEIGQLPTTYVPLGTSGTTVAKTVHTALSFTGKTQMPNAVSTATALTIGASDVFGSSSTGLNISTDVVAGGLKSTIVTAENNLVLGTKNYVVPPAPSVNNAILTSTTGGALEWKAAPTILQLTGASNLTTQIFEEVQPVGSIVAFAGPISDSNFLLCNGSAVSRTTYSDLFAVIAEIYGAGDGSTTFNLPDYQGRVPVGQGVAGGATFASDANPFGVTGGTETTSTSGHTLTSSQMPVHRHMFYDNAGHKYYAISDQNRGSAGSTANKNTLGSDAVSVQEYSNGSSGSTPDSGIDQTTYTGGGAQGGANGGTTAHHDLPNITGTSSHSHNITASNRVQPYITVHYYIKAVKNSKINFKIDVANSGLSSTDSFGLAQTLITPVDGTVRLKVKTDGADLSITEPSIRLDGSNIRLASSPFIQGDPTIRGVDLKHYHDARAGGANLHHGRIGVHGNGVNNSTSYTKDNPPANTLYNSDHDLRAIYPLWSEHAGVAGDVNPGGKSPSTGKSGSNDTYIINYASNTPNAIGDYTGGVVVNGMRTIAFQDGSFQHTAYRRGGCKKLARSMDGKHITVAPQYNDQFAYITDQDYPVTIGNGNGVKSMGGDENHGHGYNMPQPLPVNDKAKDLYIQHYNSFAIAKSGRCYSQGYGYSSANTTSSSATANSTDQWFQWQRAFCENDNVKFKTVCGSGDIGFHNAYALTEDGYLFGSGGNTKGQLANGNTVWTNSESTYSAATDIFAKRDTMASAAEGWNLSTNRLKKPHVMNPMLDSTGNVTTTIANAVSLRKFVSAGSAGSAGHENVVFALGDDGKVYTCGYGHYGQQGNGTSGSGASINSDWNIVHKSTPEQDAAGQIEHLTNIVALYNGGEDYYTYCFALDSSGDVWFWGHNRNGIGGIPTNTGSNQSWSYARKTWDAAAKGYKASHVLTQNSHSNDAASVSIIISEEDINGNKLTGKLGWYTGGNDQGSAGVGNVNTKTSWTQMTNGPMNSTLYDVQEFWISNGNVHNQSWVLARRKSTKLLELYAAGYNGHGSIAQTTSNLQTANNFVNHTPQSTWVRQKNHSDELETLINISAARQYNTGENVFAHYADGTVKAKGYMRWTLGVRKDVHDVYQYNWGTVDTIH